MFLGASKDRQNINLDMIAHSGHHNHKDMKIWVGKDWDPEKFNPGEVRFDNAYNRWEKAFLEK